MSRISQTPKPPYYAVVFTSELTGDHPEYERMSERMVALCTQQPDFLGAETARDERGVEITVSYWSSLESIQEWKEHAIHRVAQRAGKSDWYDRFATRICKVERDNFFER